MYAQLVDFIKPGIKENEIVAKIEGWLIEQGVDRITGVNCVSGPRSNPHPHDYSDRMIRPGDLVFIDIKQAYFDEAPLRTIHAHLPRGMGLPPGYAARLRRCAYGTRGAGLRWEETYSAKLEEMGFVRGTVSPCVCSSTSSVT